jgi:hypothetical protein
VLVAAGIAVAVILGGHSGPPAHGGTHGGGTTGLTRVPICSTCASHYNPYGSGGDTTQDDAQQLYAVDGKVSTAWSTEDYYSHTLNKPGVGIYVWASQSVAAKELKVTTSTPGWAGTIYGTNTQPNLGDFKASGWTQLANATDVQGVQAFRWGGVKAYRYYLVWITALPPNSNSVAINEIALYR